MNANMNIKSMPVSYSMNAKLTKQNKKIVYIKLITMLYLHSCLNVSVKCSNPVNRSTKNLLEVNFQETGEHAVVIFITKHTQHTNAVWKYVKCMEVTVIYVIIFIFARIYCSVMQNKLNVIQQFIISSNVYLLSIVNT